MWTYAQETGELKHNGLYVWTGYSGTGKGRNNPSMQNVSKIGPIPRGLWKVGPPTDAHLHLGPYTLPLTPMEGTNTFGRSEFFLHGDNPKHDASEGCIIRSPKSDREKVWVSNDHILEVI